MDKLAQGLPSFSAEDVMEKIRRFGDTAKNYASQGTDAITDWYKNIDPEAKQTLMRGLAGAGAVGTGVAALRALTPKDPETSTSKHILGPALLAALLGGGASAGLPHGLKMLSGDIRLEKEKPRSGASKAIDKVVEPMARNPLTTAGGVIGLAKTPSLARSLSKAHKTGLLPGKMQINPKLALLSIPTGLLLGAVADRYLKGKM